MVLAMILVVSCLVSLDSCNIIIFDKLALVTRELLKTSIWALGLLKPWIKCIRTAYEMLTNCLNLLVTHATFD
jgi:hypothetical protein